MYESQVTLQGWAGSDVELRETSSGAVANFRLACTPRYFRNNEWHDGQTSWFTVTVWRGLARNVAESVRKGDPVVVQGRIRVDSWQPDGEQVPRTTWTVDAGFVGHDLNRGTSRFSRPVRVNAPDPEESVEPMETVESVESVESVDSVEEPAA
jgi:single-strand DNA-binding protein